MSSTGSDHVVALDLGGTGIKAALVNRQLRQVNVVRTPTERTDGVVRYDQLVDVVTQLRSAAEQRGVRVRGVGMAVPGIVDDESGVVRFAANLGWKDLPVRERLAHFVGLPVALGHDVRTGGLAEFTTGAGRDVDDMLFVPIGTGIAAAVFTDGRPVYASGYAGELGHLIVEPGGALCGCGQRGCLETVASARAISQRYAERSGTEVSGAIEVVERIKEGDPVALTVWQQAIEALADALVTATTLLAPEVIVIGGGLVESGDTLMEPLRRALDVRMTFHRRPRLEPAVLGDRAGFVGAALLAWRKLGKWPAA